MKKEDIKRILIRHKHKCKFKDVIEKAIYPFVIIEPDCVAEDIINYLNKEKNNASKKKVKNRMG